MNTPEIQVPPPYLDPQVQRPHAQLYNVLKELRDEFQADNLPVEEALAILALELISVEFAARYRPEHLRRKLAAIPRAKERLMERRKQEMAERRSDSGTGEL
jgi:hypothetical protein